jgi:2-dehydro-3-deoxyphosphogluconate aldolase / (4S)-4-hydroxy-2-oxoglutarate aldolase
MSAGPDGARRSRVSKLLKERVIAILRFQREAPLVEIAQALVHGGIRVLEITMDTPGAAAALGALTASLPEDVLLGAGTVMDEQLCRKAITAGARFFVTPVLRRETLACAHRYACPVISGALTPTEAWEAHEAGSDLVKLFPASSVGPSYLRSIAPPLTGVRFVPTGGVDAENVASWFAAGAVAVGVGSPLFPAEAVEARDWPAVSAAARAFLSVANAV